MYWRIGPRFVIADLIAKMGDEPAMVHIQDHYRSDIRKNLALILWISSKTKMKELKLFLNINCR